MLILSLLFFFSGVAALIYQVLWFRYTGFIFGNTVYAAGTVITAFMLGLALGARLFGSWATRLKRPVAVFGLLEIAISAYALAMPFLFGQVQVAYRWFYQNVTDDFGALTLIRFGLSIGIMLIPTVLMGATLPVLSQGLLNRPETFGRRLGWLYGINTLGAVGGIIASGFILIPIMGLLHTGYVAVGTDFTVGVVGLILGLAAFKVEPENRGAGAPEAPAAPEIMPRGWLLVLWGTGLAGFLALASEILWFRALTLIFGSTTYSFSAMLAVFLFGIGFGASAFGRFLDRTRSPLLVFALCQAGIGISTLLVMRLFDRMPGFLLEMLIRFGMSWPVMLTAQCLIALAFLLIPTLLMGLSFTAAAKAARGLVPNSPLVVSRVYAANTVGSILGSLFGSFVLLQLGGIRLSLIGVSVASVAIALVYAVKAAGGSRAIRGLLAAACAAAVVAAFTAPPQWDRRLMATGVHFSPWNFIRDGVSILDERIRGERILYYQEGVTATVSVGETLDEQRFYASGGKVEADTSNRSMMLQRMTGHLPMIFHPDARDVVNIGLGAGVTAGALSTYPVWTLDVVEIEPAARRVAELFGRENHFIMNNRLMNLQIGDGRNHLFCTTKSYDVISSDPFEPVHAGANHLYTVEHFRQAKSRLKPGGLMCQYVPLYELSNQDYMAILRSFAEVFPASLLMFTGEDTLILGFPDEPRLDYEVLRNRFAIPSVRGSLTQLGIGSVEVLIGMIVSDWRTTDKFAQPGPMNTDNRPFVEFSAPKSALTYTTFENQRVLREGFTDLPPELVATMPPEALARAEAYRQSLRDVLEANVYRESDPDRMLDLLRSAYERTPDHPAVINELASVIGPSSMNLFNQGNLQAASDQTQFLLQLHPDDFWGLHRMTTLAMIAGQTEMAAEVLRHALGLYPQSGIMRALFGKYLATMGDLEGALEEYELAIRYAPDQPEVWQAYADLQRVAGNEEAARRAEARAAAVE